MKQKTHAIIALMSVILYFILLVSGKKSQKFFENIEV